MDTSETYTKMCEKAEEIRDSWRLNAGDWMLQKPINLVQVQALAFDQEVTPNEREYFIWLPRQDQLQEMVSPRGHDSEGLHSLLGRFTFFAQHQYKDKDDMYACSYFPSMEQLWLAFVMSHLYNKTWNGMEWE